MNLNHEVFLSEKDPLYIETCHYKIIGKKITQFEFNKYVIIMV